MGNVVSTQKIESMIGFKLMIVELVNCGEKHSGEKIVAVDRVGAGNGEYVLVSRGSSARQGLENASPVDASIVGILDKFSEENEGVDV